MRQPDWQTEDGAVRLYCGDCLEVLPELEPGSVDAVVTDPPYGINTKSDGMGKLSPWADLCNAARFYSEWLAEARRISRACWSFLNWRSLVTFQKASCDIGWPIESLAVWDKCWIGPGGSNGLRPSYEMIAYWFNGLAIKNRGIPDIQRCLWAGQKQHHPAEKPVELVAWTISACEAGVVLDPFMGSGTTGVACVRRGRRFIGIEMDSRYFEIAKRRILQELERTALLEPTPVIVQRELIA